MDFFEGQDRARRNTKLLVVYFGAGVIALILSLYVAALLIFTGINSRTRRTVYYDDRPVATWWNPHLFGGVALGTLAVIAMGSLFKTMELSEGGKAVATMLGGQLVNPATTDPDERKLLNVVEEMAIAAGLPVPQVYLLPEERGINAFAAGHSTSDAVVAVTEGAVQRLTRDELQGVIGHEFSHILNGDMRLNLRLMGIIFGIVCLAVIGRVLLYTRGSDYRDDDDRRGRNPLPLFGLALIIIGGVGVFFGRLIQAAVSRQREFLADASAVQFTRNPAGLAGALKKIGGASEGSRIENPHAGEASHMFFGNGMGESFLHLLDTHPPLVARIKALEPNFDGTLLQSDEDEDEIEPALSAAAAQNRTTPSSFPFPQPGMSRLAPPIIAAQNVLANTGAPTTAHLRYAEELRDAIPARVRAEAQDPMGASTLVYALLLSEDEAVRQKQLAQLTQLTSRALVQETLRILAEAQAVVAHARLPLVDLALSALRQLSPAQYQQFKAAVKMLVEMDQEIDLFEYVLQKIVLRHLDPHFSGARKPVVQYYALKPLAADCAVLLSAMAHAGQSEDAQVEAAFRQGAQALSYAAQTEIPLLSPEQCDLGVLDKALNRISAAVPQIKKNVLNACALTVAADGVVQEVEAELLRAIADTLDCPMPPFLASPSS